MPRRKIVDDPRSERERQKHFLQAYADTFSLSAAGRLANVSTESHHRWFRKDSKYRDTFKELKENSLHYLESVGIERAGEGWLEPVFYQGTMRGVRRFDSGCCFIAWPGASEVRIEDQRAGAENWRAGDGRFVRPGEVSPGE